MKRSLRWYWVLASILSLTIVSVADAAEIQVVPSQGDLTLNCPGEFSLRFSKGRGGGITQAYDLAQDPGKTTNLAAQAGSLYDGLFFVMFKQADPEAWTANFRSSASVLEVVEATPHKVKIHAAGDFPGGGFGLPASYDFVYVVTSSGEIFIRTRLTFKQAYANNMQIRLAMALSAAYATPSGWVEFSEDTDLTPYYYQNGGDDDYLGARINNGAVRLDPVLIAHRDWGVADYILSIAPPRADECLIAWVSSRPHQFSAGQTIERKFLLLLNQRDINSHADPASLAAAYRAGNGGDFDGSLGGPQAVIEASPTSGTAPLTVDFDGASSTDPDGSIATYEWDFGDGEEGSGATTTHVFRVPGSYDVNLTVRDDDSNENVATVIVKVGDPRITIVDNSDSSPLFSSSGSWLTSQTNSGFYGSNYALNEVGAGQDWARWRPDLDVSGPYRVYASWTTDSDRPTDAPFTVHHANGSETIEVDMRDADDSGWNLLGEFEFASGTAGYVELTDGASDGSEVVADAIKLEYVGEAGPGDPSIVDDPPSVEDGGVQSEGGAAGAAGNPVEPDHEFDSETESTADTGCTCTTQRRAESWPGFWLGILLVPFARRRRSVPGMKHIWLSCAAALVHLGCGASDADSTPAGNNTGAQGGGATDAGQSGAGGSGGTGTGGASSGGSGGIIASGGAGGSDPGGAGGSGGTGGSVGTGGVSGGGPPLSRAMQWVRENPMFISGQVVGVGAPPESAVHEYFETFHATAVHLWADGLPNEMNGWMAPGRPDFRFVSWVQQDGTSAANGQLIGGYPPNPTGRIGYQISDEPRSMAELHALQTGIDAVRQHDPDAFIIVNFYTHVDNADEMVEYYAQNMGGDIISYDRYTPSQREYPSLERYRRVGLQYGMPYWRYVLSYETDEPCDSTESDLRWKAFTGFVYGYTGVTWFVYQIASDHGEVRSCLYEGIGSYAAAKTSQWHIAAQLNVEMANLGRAITQLTSTDVRYIPSVPLLQPEGTSNWAIGAGGDPYITNIAPAPGNAFLDILAGFFVDDAGERYVMVQNVRHANGDWPIGNATPGTVRLFFDFSTAPSGFDKNSVLSLNRVTGAVESMPLADGGGNVRALDIHLAAGDPLLFKYSTGTPFALQ